MNILKVLSGIASKSLKLSTDPDEDTGDRIVKVVIGLVLAAVVLALAYVFYQPRVSRYATWDAAAANGLGGAFPRSGRDLVHAWHVTRSVEDHWFVFRAPFLDVHSTGTRVALAEARSFCPPPPSAMGEWLFNNRPTADSLALVAFRERGGIAPGVVIFRTPSSDRDTVTYYVAECQPTSHGLQWPKESVSP